MTPDGKMYVYGDFMYGFIEPFGLPASAERSRSMQRPTSLLPRRDGLIQWRQERGICLARPLGKPIPICGQNSRDVQRGQQDGIIDRAVGLSPLQFGMSLQVAQDVAAREDSLDSAIRDNR